MSKELMLDVDQAGELKAAFRRTRGSDGSEWTNERIKKLSEGSILGQVLDVINDQSTIVQIKKKVSEVKSNSLIVDYGVAPSLVGLKIKSHSEWKGVIEYNLSFAKFERVLTLKPGENSISGHENLKRLDATGKVLLDVRVLEELLKRPELIPEEWKKGLTYFWGTIFRDLDDNLYVACLNWNGGVWYWGGRWLDFGWNNYGFAACLNK